MAHGSLVMFCKANTLLNYTGGCDFPGFTDFEPVQIEHQVKFTSHEKVLQKNLSVPEPSVQFKKT